AASGRRGDRARRPDADGAAERDHRRGARVGRVRGQAPGGEPDAAARAVQTNGAWDQEVDRAGAGPGADGGGRLMQTEEELRLYGAGYQLAEQAARIAELEMAAIAVTFDGEIKAETRIACLRSALDLAGQALQARDREIARLHDLLGKLLA